MEYSGNRERKARRNTQILHAFLAILRAYFSNSGLLLREQESKEGVNEIFKSEPCGRSSLLNNNASAFGMLRILYFHKGGNTISRIPISPEVSGQRSVELANLSATRRERE